MSPLLLPIILGLYCFFSFNKDVRVVCKVLILFQLLSVLITMHAQNHTQAAIYTLSTSLIGFILCAILSKQRAATFTFSIITLCLILVYIPILHPSHHTLVLYGKLHIFYENSNYILREGVILAVTLVRCGFKGNFKGGNKDVKIDVGCVFMYIMERLLMDN